MNANCDFFRAAMDLLRALAIGLVVSPFAVKCSRNWDIGQFFSDYLSQFNRLMKQFRLVLNELICSSNPHTYFIFDVNIYI